MDIPLLSFVPEQFFPLLLLAGIIWIFLEYISITRRLTNLILSLILAFAVISFFTQSVSMINSVIALIGTNGVIILIPLLFIFGSILGFRKRHAKIRKEPEIEKLRSVKESLLSQLQKVKGDENKERVLVEEIDRLDKQILYLKKKGK